VRWRHPRLSTRGVAEMKCVYHILNSQRLLLVHSATEAVERVEGHLQELSMLI